MRGNKERETRKRLDKAWTWIPAQVHAGMTGGGVDLVSRSSACGNDGEAWHAGTTERAGNDGDGISCECDLPSFLRPFDHCRLFDNT